MKVCDYGCGTQVRFVVLDYDGSRPIWSPPMESLTREVKRPRAKAGEDFKFPDVVVTERFTVHECEGSRAAHQEKRAQQQRNHEVAKDQARRTKEAWKEALKKVCPKCNAERRVRCVNLTDVRLGREVRETSWPHRERLPEGFGNPVEAPQPPAKN